MAVQATLFSVPSNSLTRFQCGQSDLLHGDIFLALRIVGAMNMLLSWGFGRGLVKYVPGVGKFG